MRKYGLGMIVVMLSILFTFGCNSTGSGVPDPDQIVPDRDALIEKLEEHGYTVQTLSSTDGVDLIVDRVLAENGDKFIDIVYGLSSEDAETVFAAFCERYTDNYYILARNGNYVYCVSDKKTFSKAGFTSTDNVGTQYIHE